VLAGAAAGVGGCSNGRVVWGGRGSRDRHVVAVSWSGSASRRDAGLGADSTVYNSRRRYELSAHSERWVALESAHLCRAGMLATTGRGRPRKRQRGAVHPREDIRIDVLNSVAAGGARRVGADGAKWPRGRWQL
jgi:hypothetical protein